MKVLNKKLQPRKQAFTLIEISIVILIVATLMSGGLMVFANNLNNEAIKVTKERMDVIYQAMGKYLIANKRLPCPAPINISKSMSTTYGDDTATGGMCDSAGSYTSTTNSDLVYGMIPVQDLDLSSEMAQDGFGTKFSYIVHKDYTKASSYTGDNFGTSNAANITIKERKSVDKEIANDVVFIIISHGYNRLGSFNANADIQNPAPTNSYEISNFADIITTTTANFDNEFYASSTSSDNFDDIVFFKNRNSFVTDFNAFFTIPCKSDSPNHDDVTYSSTTMTWPNALYGQIVAANENCPLGYTGNVARPTKRCGFNGKWETGAVKPCVQQKVTSVCTGGNMIYISGLKVVHAFTSDGTFECSNNINAEIFAIGGGGGGGGGGDGYDYPGAGGGGGGGEYVLLSNQTITSSDTLTIVIGDGGAGGGQGSDGGVGENTTIDGLGSTITALGGNGGGHADNNQTNPVVPVINADAPGGGSCGSTVLPADKTGGRRAGGDIDQTCGGGASQDNIGGNGNGIVGGTGGAGFAYLDGVTYGSGGGGGLYNYIHTGPVAFGGGEEAGNGAWSYANIHATNGLAGRGGGGGGGGAKNATNRIGGNGGSGVVLISFEY